MPASSGSSPQSAKLALPSPTTVERRAAKAERYAHFAAQQGWSEIERFAADLRALIR
jgi:hypothetical protein